MQRITPERVITILKTYGQDVTPEEARWIIEFMRLLADIEIQKILNYEDSRFVREGKYR